MVYILLWTIHLVSRVSGDDILSHRILQGFPYNCMIMDDCICGTLVFQNFLIESLYMLWSYIHKQNVLGAEIGNNTGSQHISVL